MISPASGAQPTQHQITGASPHRQVRWGRYVAGFLLRYLAVLLGASLLIFILLALVPGNPAAVSLGVHATEEDIAALSTKMGFDAPWWQRYLTWLTGMLTGDFGTSLASQTPITPTLFDRLHVTLIIVGLAMLLACIFAIPLGIYSARRNGRFDAQLLTIASQLGLAIPSFFAGILAIAFFGIALGWLPTGGWIIPASNPEAFARHLILPVGCLAFMQAAIVTRYVRVQTLELLQADFIRTSRALGAGPWEVLWRHGFRAMAPAILNTIGVQSASLLIGAVLVEEVFVIPGIGQYLLEAVAQRDLPVIQAVLMVLVFIALTINTLVDASQRVFHPRTRNSQGFHAAQAASIVTNASVTDTTSSTKTIKVVS
ncbi:MAG: ABC transporter permease [Corynebacterium sp.]|nr:ABC transporter permease [Corynebacterium sp.]